MVLIQRRMGYEKSWYGLLMMGFGAAMGAYLAMMGVGLLYNAVFLPAELGRDELVGRIDVLFINFFMLGILLELAKSYGVTAFDTEMTRGNWTAYGLAIGTGAGLCQTFWLLGATSLSVLGGLEVGSLELWLVLRCGAVTWLEAVLGASILYSTAKNARVSGVLVFGGAHGLALLLPGLAALSPALAGWQPWLGSLAAFSVGAMAALHLWWRVRTHGWPT